MRRKLVSKNKKRTVTRLLLIALALAAAVAAVILLPKHDKNELPVTFTELPLFDTAKYAYNGSGILYISGDKLCYKDFTSEKNDYSLAVGSGDVSIAASSGLELLYNSAAVQIIGSQYPIEFSGALISVKCGASYVAALQQETAGVTLQIFSSTEQVDQMEFKDTYLVDYGFASSANNVLWTITLDTGGSMPVCTLTTYDMDKATTTGVMTMQGHIAEHVCISDSSIFVVGTNNLIRYSSAVNSESYRLLVYGWELKDYSMAGERPMFLFTRRGSTSLTTVRLYTVSEGDAADEKVVTIWLPMGVTNAFISGGRLIAVAPDKLYTYNSSGTLVSTTPLSVYVEELIKLSDQHMIARNGDALYLMKIR